MSTTFVTQVGIEPCHHSFLNGGLTLVAMDHRIKRALEMLDSGYTREVCLEILAAQLNISYSRFRHMFKSETGVSPAQYVKTIRMEKACYLLKTTFLSIKQVMAEVGLNDISHFVRDFKKEYGLTPSEYRDRFNRGAMSAERSPSAVSQIG